MLGLYPVASTTPGSFYLGVFALGMVGADLRFGDPARWERIEARIPWRTVLIALTLTLIVPMYLFNFLSSASALRPYGGILAHSIVGLITVCLILLCSRRRDRIPLDPSGDVSHTTPLIVRCLKSRVAVKLGTFSYSLYLIHYPVLDFIVKHLHGEKASPLMKLIVVGPACVVAALLASYGFHLLVERQFMSAAALPRSSSAPIPVPSPTL